MWARLVGIHKVRWRNRVYYYAWRGGPRIKAEPNTRAFLAEFHRLTRTRSKIPETGTIAELVRHYVSSAKYSALKDKTKRSYDAAISAIEQEFFDLDISAISEKGARRLFVEWRDRFSETPRTADLYLSVLALIIAYGVDLELVERNPLTKVSRLSDGTRRDAVWAAWQVQVFHHYATREMSLAMELARWTGQRQGDLLRLPWSAYDGTHLTVRQSKTRTLVRFKVAEELKALLDKTPRVAVTILATSRKRSFTESGFRASWRKVCERAKLDDEDITFHDLRGTFCTLLRKKGASYKEIAEISGHSERDAERIIRKHYEGGSAAIEKLETGNKKRGGV